MLRIFGEIADGGNLSAEISCAIHAWARPGYSKQTICAYAWSRRECLWWRCFVVFWDAAFFVFRRGERRHCEKNWNWYCR